MIYVVRPGDTLYELAERYGISADQIAYDNQIQNRRALVPGEALLLRGVEPEPEPVR